MDTMNDLNSEELLDHFPLSKEELDHILSTASTGAAFTDFRLESMFQQSTETVFCTNPKNQLLETIVSVCGRRGDRFLFDMMAKYIETTDSKTMVSLLFECSNDTSLSTATHWMDLFQSKTDSVTWRDWLQRTVPYSTTVIANAFCRVFGLAESTTMAKLEVLDCEPLWKKHTMVDQQLVLMGLGGKWKSMFDSQVDGMSFLTLQQALLGFSGPTMLLIETMDGDILGYYTTVAWKEAKKWHSGDGDSCLFRLSPHWNVYRRQMDHPAPYHQYLNHAGKHLAGIAVGGIEEFTPRLHLTVDLDDQCKACSAGSVFDNGELLTADTSFFAPERIQIWALADDAFEQNHARGQQTIEQREWTRQRLAKVDKREFLDHFVLDSKVFGHRDQLQGRVDDEALVASATREA